MSKVMVTGSEGGVGRAIIRELTENGHEVLGFDRAVNQEDAHAVGSDILDHEAVLKARPSSVKGQYLKKITISSTMGPSVLIDHQTL